jgi:uncharacterized repeat protein (TIGR03803 family)
MSSRASNMSKIAHSSISTVRVHCGLFSVDISRPLTHNSDAFAVKAFPGVPRICFSEARFPMRPHYLWITAGCILALFGMRPISSSGAPPAGREKAIYSFQGGTDGAAPMSDLTLDSAGNLYGTTSQGGTGTCGGCGTVFELKRSQDGWKEEVLYSFGAYQGDGVHPQAGLIFDSAGNLYGTTIEGLGDNSADGTVFKLSPNGHGGWTERVIYSFPPDQSAGANPSTDLVFDSHGNLYGTASIGGGNANSCYGSGCGTVFKLTPQSDGSWRETTVHIFTDTGGDGAYPSSGFVLDSAGNLYGLTKSGGTGSCQIRSNGSPTVFGCGTLYELILNSDEAPNVIALYNFVPGGGFGIYPSSGICFDNQSHLLGTTQRGGDGFGTVFELQDTKEKGWQQNEAHIFDGIPDGAGPVGRLTTDANGDLFGATSSGATFTKGLGTVFEVQHAKNAWSEKILHSFAGSPDGATPSAGLISDSRGHLYGTTLYGGTGTGCVHGCGTVYQVTP